MIELNRAFIPSCWRGMPGPTIGAERSSYKRVTRYDPLRDA